MGYSMAGYRELLAVEWNDNAVATFQLNFPDVPVYHGDIAKLSVTGCMKLAGLTGPGQLDVLDGSPPCQGFSTAGKRQMGDSRNQLFREFVRLLEGLQPKVFVMENVPGLVKGKMKLVFAEIMRELKATGYQVKCRKLNAKWFNVPQSRERLIWIGTKQGDPSYPGAGSRLVTVREAFTNIGNPGPIQFPTGACERITKEMKPGEDGNDAFQRLNRTSVRRWFGLKRLEFDRPAKTLVKSILSGQIHPLEDRYLTGAELKRIGSFCDSFEMIGDLSIRWSLIGNSVPPLFMRAIARHIRQELLTPLLAGSEVSKERKVQE